MKRILAFSVEGSPLSLSSLAEIALAYGPVVSLDSPYLLLDVTGCAHFYERGERELAEQLARTLGTFGGVPRLVVTSGPRFARAMLRGLSGSLHVVPEGDERAVFGGLPLSVLEFDESALRLLTQLGLRTVDDVASIPRAELATRLSSEARSVFSLLEGDDRTPLVPYVPVEKPVECMDLEWSLSDHERLAFVVKRLVDRLSARLVGLRQGASELCLRLTLDRALLDSSEEPVESLSLKLSSPTSSARDLLALLRIRLERTALRAPVRSLSLAVTETVRIEAHALSFFDPIPKSEAKLPPLVTELVARYGEEHVGRLSLVDRFGVRERSKLLPVREAPLSAHPYWLSGATEPTRLLPVRSRFDASRISKVTHVLRLADHEWWTKGPNTHDLFRGWIDEIGFGFFDRDELGHVWLEGWVE